eukprot:scaffold15742_cov71-Phaeocystis_antarctica.AAC.6
MGAYLGEAERESAPSGSAASSEGSHSGSAGAEPRPRSSSWPAITLAGTKLGSLTPSAPSVVCRATSALSGRCTRSECETRAMETLALVQARSASVMYRIHIEPQCARPRDDE